MRFLRNLWQRHPFKISIIYAVLSTVALARLYLAVLDSANWFGAAVIGVVAWIGGFYFVLIFALLERGVVKGKRDQ